MKSFFYLGALFILMSCSQTKKPISLQIYEAADSSFSIEVPVGYSLAKNTPETMAFNKDNDGLISVDKLAHLDAATFRYLVSKDLESLPPKFTKNIIEENDSIISYKISAGMFSAYQSYFHKISRDSDYYIKISAQYLSLEDSKNIAKTLNIRKADTQKNMFVTYASETYSIDHPKNWKITEKPDGISDVYIGESKIGLTILHFETDHTLKKINDESNNNASQAGISIKQNKLINLNGMSCYQTVLSLSVNGIHAKQISYTLKKGNILYNIKFGSDPDAIDAKKSLVNQIIHSLKIKL